jgi:hypothetical protein
MNIYFGPYVRCEVHWIGIEETIKGCPKCHRAVHETFCGTCGSERTDIKKTFTRQKVICQQFLATLDERLSGTALDQDFDLLLSNVKIAGVRKFHLDSCDEANIVVSPEQIAFEKEAFQNHFADDLLKVQEAYGGYIIEWGLLIW